MKAPNRSCFKCGKKHWGACHPNDVELDAALTDLRLFGRAAIENLPNGTKRNRGPEVARQLEESLPVKARASRGTFDRVAYQREYMRRRRAKTN